MDLDEHVHTVEARSVPTEFHVVLTGAGISIDPPAALPSAGALAAHVWTALTESIRGHFSADAATRVGENLWRLRMEQFLELITSPGRIPTDIIVDVYDLVGGGAYNRNHLRLGALDVRHFTLNMDLLLEEAVPGIEITHLHGKWNEKETIKTTVSHYSAGLDPEVEHDFAAAIHDATVLVIGYSGRDTDVIPLFAKYPPRRIVWVSPYRRKWEYEAQELQKAYDRGDYGPGREFEARHVKAGQYLPSLVRRVPTPPGTTSHVPAPQICRRLERETSLSQRLIAVAAVLFDLGFYAELLEVLQPVAFDDALEIQRRKLVARVLSRQGHAQKAMNLLLTPPRRPAYVRAWLGNATEVAALGPRTAWWSRVIGRGCRGLILAHGAVSSEPRVQRRRMLAQIRDAKHLSVRGETTRAIDLARRVLDADALESVLGDASLVDALTWEADALKSRGDLACAQAAAQRADRLGVYSNFGQAAYAKWKLVEVRALTGPAGRDDAEKFQRDNLAMLKTAADLAELQGDLDQLAWICGTWAELLIEEHPRLAQRQIDKARNLGAAEPIRSPFGRSYHLLQAAAVARRLGRLGPALKLAEQSLLAERGSRTPVPSVRLQGEQLRAEIRWEEDPTWDLAAELDRLADEYREHEMYLGEARALVAAAALRHDYPPAALRDRAVALGWHDLEMRVSGRAGAYPWAWSILF